jgi:hypothetical protein
MRRRAAPAGWQRDQEMIRGTTYEGMTGLIEFLLLGDREALVLGNPPQKSSRRSHVSHKLPALEASCPLSSSCSGHRI